MPVGDPVKSVYGWTIRLSMHLLYALLQIHWNVSKMDFMNEY